MKSGMNVTTPTLEVLFEQLGLPADQDSIDSFINSHKGLADSIHIEDAPFWTNAQASFINGALNEDAEWAEIIDQLNSRLR